MNYMNNRTTITIFEKTEKRLDALGKKNESYDELINRLINERG